MIKTLTHLVTSIKGMFTESKEQALLEVAIKDRLSMLVGFTTNWEYLEVGEDAHVLLNIMEELGDYKGLCHILDYSQTCNVWTVKLKRLMGPEPFRETLMADGKWVPKAAVDTATANDQLLRSVSPPIDFDQVKRVFSKVA